MYRFTALILPAALALLGGVAIAAAQTTQMDVGAAPDPDIERFMKIRAPQSPALMSDGTMYVRDWPDGIRQLYKRERGAAVGSPLEQLTFFEDGISGFSVSDDESKIIISASIGGSEQNDLFLIDAATKKQTTLFSSPDIVYSFNTWLPNSSGFIYSANDDSPADFHLYTYDFASGESKKISDRAGYWIASDVRDDGQRALISRYFAANNAEAYELDMNTGETTPIRVDESKSYNWAQGYLPGGHQAAFVSDVDNGMRRLYIYDLEDGTATAAFSGDLNQYEVEGGDINADRSLAALTFNEDGYSTLRVFKLPELTEIPVNTGDKGLVGSVDLRGNQLTYTLNNARSPGLAYTKGVFTRENPRQITTADDQGIDLSQFTLPKLVKYESFDGLEVPAFLYLPPNYEPGTQIPFIANYHGGPEGQHRPRFDPLTQYLLSRGYGVIKPNVRGSSGYGRDYLDMDNYTKRWDSVRDGVEAVRWLIDEGYTRPGMVAAYGGSYGGFMAVATIIEGGDLYGASINIVGIVNFKTFLEQTKSYRRKLREVEYGPLSDPDFLHTISPINRIDEIQVPMMIAHGLNDPRVPVGEAMQLAVGLQQRGFDPELLFFPDEGHGFAKLDNRMLFAKRVDRFLQRTLGTAGR